MTKKKGVDQVGIKKNDFFPPDVQNEVLEAEHEFGELLTEAWEAICLKPAVHAKAVRTAKKLRELKNLLHATRQIPQSIH